MSSVLIASAQTVAQVGMKMENDSLMQRYRSFQAKKKSLKAYLVIR
jgi:hypothetical protein